MEGSEIIQEQKEIQNKPSRRKFILAAVIIPLLIIVALVFSFLKWEPKSDPASEALIRQVVANTLSHEAKIVKEPNDLTDEDFVKISEIRLGLLRISSLFTSPSKELADINILEKCSNLQTLRLENINYPTKAIPKWMKILAKFGIFDLNKRFTIDLRPIEKLNSLHHLTIYNVPLKNLEPLAGIDSLQRLFLENIQLSDLEPIKGLKNLNILSLNDSQFSNLKPIKDLVNLQILSLDNTQVSDIKPLKGLVNLETLIVSNTLISDLEPLKDLVNLRELFVHNTRVCDLEPIKGLKKLERLYITNCKNITAQQVEDLQKALPNLEIKR